MASSSFYYYIFLHVLLLSISNTATSATHISQPPSTSPSPSPSPSPQPLPPPNYSLPPLPPPQTTPSDIDAWCATVPHPAPCRHFLTSKSSTNNTLISKLTDFRHLAVQVALTRAVYAQRRTWTYGRKCHSHPDRAAWSDCVKLYDYAILLLNRTLTGLNSPISCTNFDAQTWLSASLTNLETCASSSSDFNLTYFSPPHLTYNVSELISNTLAINAGILVSNGNTHDTENNNNKNNNNSDDQNSASLPPWLTATDRRLLLSRRELVVEKARFVVAQDGSGQFRTVQAAVNAAGRVKENGRKVIYVKRGVYREIVRIGFNTDDVMLIGDGIKNTIITGSRSTSKGFTTYNAPTTAVDGARFIARGITFQNAAGPTSGQAPAFRSGSDLSVYYQCAFIGYQDTLFTHSQRQFYKQCYIFGTIDIIFGNAAAVFQNCMILARNPAKGQANVVTAQGRLDPNQNTGIVIHNSVIRADKALQTGVQTYLGRPWKGYSRVVIMKSRIDGLVSKEGWLDWDGRSRLNTLYFAEYRNVGPGSGVSGRVKWPGFHKLDRVSDVEPFTVEKFIAGKSWIPETGVPFHAGI